MVENNNTMSQGQALELLQQSPLVTNGHGKPHYGDVGHSQADERKETSLFTRLLHPRPHYLAVFTTVFIIGSFFISYGIAVSRGDVEPDFPYISYTAIHAPERCIFAQLINVGAFLLAVVIRIRYLQMSEVLALLDAAPRDKTINRASLGVGWISAFGLTVVANFQVVEMRAVHYTGAGLAFALGLVYCWLQTSLSLRYCRWSVVAVTQLILSILVSICCAVFTTSSIVYNVRKAQGLGTKWDSLRGVYLTSTISEWLTAASIVTFELTFYRDFSHIELESSRVRVSDRSLVLMDYRFRAQTLQNTAAPIFRPNGHIAVV